jgi:hypothetical protein
MPATSSSMPGSPAAPSAQSPPSQPEVIYESTPVTSARSLRQLSLFAFGAACFLASTAITRKAIYRRNLRLVPKFYEPNTNPHEHFSPFHDALAALGLATMNCLSVGTMMVGGALWSVDISGVGEMRTILRGRLGYDIIYSEDQEAPQSAADSLEASISRKREENASKQSPTTPR